ncbi:MAG: hypothetical protein ACOYKE_01895 [Ferruginibacter sp.]
MEKQDHTLYYDENCPLCAAYSQVFVQTGLLTPSGRKSFSNITENQPHIDLARAVNEIPLLNQSTGNVLYGIDALLEIIGKKIPFIKKVGNIQPIKWCLVHFYKLISYNRKVVVAQLPKNNASNCTPTFNITYRMFFILLLCTSTYLFLLPVQQTIMGLQNTPSNAIQFQTKYLIWMTINGAIAFYLGKIKGIEFIGQISMMSFLSIIYALPLLILQHWIPLSILSIEMWMGCFAILMLKAYYRRMQFCSNRFQQAWLVYFIPLVSFFMVAIFL